VFFSHIFIQTKVNAFIDKLGLACSPGDSFTYYPYVDSFVASILNRKNGILDLNNKFKC
jgi:hypothetical protein